MKGELVVIGFLAFGIRRWTSNSSIFRRSQQARSSQKRKSPSPRLDWVTVDRLTNEIISGVLMAFELACVDERITINEPGKTDFVVLDL